MDTSPAGVGAAHATARPSIAATLQTDVVSDDPDDPAMWLHPTDPSRSLILGTNKVASPAGALVVFGLDGRIRQTIAPIDRPNNVDVEYGVSIGAESADIAVVTERLQHRLIVFRIDRQSGRLTEIGRVPILAGETGERAEPMGIALYRRPGDAAVFAVVAPKTGDSTNYLWQYRLTFSAPGGVTGALVRRFGHFSAIGPEPGDPGEIEAVAVDDELGYVYFSDERFGIRKWQADPDHPDAGRELAAFGKSGYTADREGLAIWVDPSKPGAGYLVSVDQIEQRSVLKAYSRQGAPNDPHDHSTVVFEVVTNADSTDGVEVTSASLPNMPQGLAVMMNSEPKNFLVFDWRHVAGGR